MQPSTHSIFYRKTMIILLGILEKHILFPIKLMPETGIEPISESYKESVLPLKLFRHLDQYNNLITVLVVQTSCLEGTVVAGVYTTPSGAL